MRKPIIGLVPLVDETKDSYWMLPGYMKAIEEAGGIGVMFPLTGDQEDLKQLMEQVDGILFTGGHDVDPALYKEEKLDICGTLCQERDEMEAILFRLGLEADLPMFGICRGLQFFNVMCGGSLYQDLPAQRPTETIHCQKHPYDQPIHKVELVEGSPLEQVLSVKTLGVNSYHHQAIKELGQGLCAMAYSEDGLVEAIAKEDKKFVWAVQWHPEFSHLVEESSRKIMKVFVDHCKKTTLEFIPLYIEDTEQIKEMSQMATAIVREHFDPIIGEAQNDYMLERFQTVDSIREQLSHGSQYYFVEAAGRRVGFVAMYPRADAMYISKFYLYKEERGKGYAHQMLQFVKDETRKAKLAGIELNVNKNNSACKAYDSLGFQVIRAEKNDIGQGFYMDDYVYRMELKKEQ